MVATGTSTGAHAGRGYGLGEPGRNSLAKVVEHARGFRKILVTGPQRSGTTIASRILAHELRYRFVSEKDIKTHSLSRLHKRLFSWRREVIQGPCFGSICHYIDTPRTLIVFMRRDLSEIVQSEHRIGWSAQQWELANYFRDAGTIAAVRYECWEKYQQGLMEVPWIELAHASLAPHRLWIDREKRLHFKDHQTE
ncbi:MAG: hypothetical protein H0T95_13960 [Chthoniobacterales bacterium]|nr:hypothetical protein [Chthoniobacterales bacterium]